MVKTVMLQKKQKNPLEKHYKSYVLPHVFILIILCPACYVSGTTLRKSTPTIHRRTNGTRLAQ